MMEEWCSPYSSWPSTMNGCSGRTPPPSGPAVGTRVSVSSASTWSSGQGSASGPPASGFFSAHCTKQSRHKSAVRGRLWARLLPMSGDRLGVSRTPGHSPRGGSLWSLGLKERTLNSKSLLHRQPLPRDHEEGSVGHGLPVPANKIQDTHDPDRPGQ